MKKMITTITLIASVALPTMAIAKPFCLKQWSKSQNRFLAQSNDKTNFFNAQGSLRAAAQPTAVNKRK